jgi:hypothetical protein
VDKSKSFCVIDFIRCTSSNNCPRNALRLRLIGVLNGRLQLSLQHREWRFQFVGGVGAEPRGLLKTSVESFHHPVEHGDETRKLLVLLLRRKTLVEPARGHGFRRERQHRQRPQGALGKEIPTSTHAQHGHDARDGIEHSQIRHTRLKRAEIDAYDQFDIRIAHNPQAPHAVFGCARNEFRRGAGQRWGRRRTSSARAGTAASWRWTLSARAKLATRRRRRVVRPKVGVGQVFPGVRLG